VIRSFKSAETAAIARGERVRRFVAFEKAARRKLWYLGVAAELGDLMVPPGNRLEALRGDRAGQFSIRINEQYRVCFRWVSGAAEDVEIVDYH
jgi:proteic killer suppression protein